MITKEVLWGSWNKHRQARAANSGRPTSGGEAAGTAAQAIGAYPSLYIDCRSGSELPCALWAWTVLVRVPIPTQQGEVGKDPGRRRLNSRASILTQGSHRC